MSIVTYHDLAGLFDRLDTIRTTPDEGLMDDVATLLDIAMRSNGVTLAERRAILNIASELILGWERRIREQAAEDAYWTEREKEQANV